MATLMRPVLLGAATLITMGFPLACLGQLNAAKPVEAPSATSKSWNFQVTLDGDPIGTHAYALQRDGEQMRLKANASFDVKILFVNAYRYRHQVTEVWQSGCLSALDSQTDDDGRQMKVHAAKDGDELAVTSPQPPQRLSGCVMSFAYWNPLMLKQNRLLNAQTGKFQDVMLTTLPDEPIQVRGSSVQAKHYRLSGLEKPIELWYGPDGDWLALQTTVGGDKTLRYRLQ